jgi:hypothetical protein
VPVWALFHCQAAASHLHYIALGSRHQTAPPPAAAEIMTLLLCYATLLLLLLRLLLRTVHLP